MTKKAAAAKRPRLDAETKAGLAFTSPFIIGFLLFMIVPMMISLYYSVRLQHFVGPGICGA